MEKLNFLKDRKVVITAGILAVFLLLVIITGFVKKSASEDTAETITYTYTDAEQKLADAVKEYITEYLNLSEEVKGQIADAAVQNYNIVMQSDTDFINNAVTEAVKNRIRSSITAFYEEADQLTNEDLDALASGITEIIWNAVLSALEDSGLSEEEAYRDSYYELTDSLQAQIDQLKEQKTKVSINARVIDRTDLSGKEILSGINKMSEEELAELSEKLGMSIEEIKELLNNSNNEIGKDILEQLQDEIDDLKKDLEDEIDASAGKPGAAGKTGEKGEKGEKGAAGKDGNDGADGKTTYIAYADDPFGTNFSLTPTETSKYAGTCITADEQQPADYTLYGNWQEYRAYIITATTDESGVTTVHIN